jgi:pyruvate carboxylase
LARALLRETCGSKSTERYLFQLFIEIVLDNYFKVRAVSVEDNNSAVETVSREKATSDPGSVGAPMSGVVVEVRVKEGQEIKKGDPLCGKLCRKSKTLKTLTIVCFA